MSDCSHDCQSLNNFRSMLIHAALFATPLERSAEAHGGTLLGVAGSWNPAPGTPAWHTAGAAGMWRQYSGQDESIQTVRLDGFRASRLFFALCPMSSFLGIVWNASRAGQLFASIVL